MKREDFPMLFKGWTYLDSAATTQKPRCVIDKITNFYQEEYATVNRAVYDLSLEASMRYQHVRRIVKDFLFAEKEEEIVFTKGTTDSINLLANAFPFQKGDEIILTEMEHHSNLVPWQLLQERVGVKLRFVPFDENGEINLDVYQSLFTPHTKLVCIPHVSNVFGTVNPIQKMVEIAHQFHAKVLVDGAQAAPHRKVSVKDLDVDFYAFSSHKAYGPTGVGVLYGKYDSLCQLHPFQGGGDMIDQVTFEKTTYAMPPLRFEAGTPNIAGIIGFGKAIRSLSEMGMDAVESHGQELVEYALDALKKLPGIKIIGNPKIRSSIISFVVDNVHPLDIGTVLNLKKIAIRTGHLCAMPLLHKLGIDSLCRVSFGIYNNKSDVDMLIEALEESLLLISS